MRSQVQVLAGPPLFSQLRELTRPTRSRSLPAWAAVGPHVLPTRRAKDPAGAGDPGPRSTTRAPLVVAAVVQPQVMVGLMPPTLPLTTCAQPCHSLGCTAGIPAPRPTCDPAQPACPWPARRSNLARCPSASTTTTRFSPMSLLAQQGLRRLSGPGSGRCRSCSRVRQGGQTHGPGRVAVRRAPRSHRCGHNGRGRGRGGRADTDAGHPDTRTPGHRTSGHWTPGT
jgi:hypothetical protein